MPPKVVVISGAASNTGKTTLLCDLLRELSRENDCEAIKVTRGHYRSCGKDPAGCCVSDMLGEEPSIRSGREETYEFGKDTARYLDAGASNVHWVIATSSQVEQGIKTALERVHADTVLVEGTSLLKHIEPEFSILVLRSDQTSIKPSARAALKDGLIDAVYISSINGDMADPRQSIPESSRALINELTCYTQKDFILLLNKVHDAIHSDRL